MKKSITYLQDAKQIHEHLKNEESYYERILEMFKKSVGVSLTSSARVLPDGTNICLNCGFPLPYTMHKCPCCGADLKPVDHEVYNKNKNAHRWISVFETHKGEHGSYLVQRQFFVSQDIELRGNAMLSPKTFEVYHNIRSETGSSYSFRRGLKMFPNFITNPFSEYTDIKYRQDNPNYGGWCPWDWDEAINERAYNNFKKKFPKTSKPNNYASVS